MDGVGESQPRSARVKKPLQFKTYVVMQRTFRRQNDPHKPNAKIIAVKLTEAAAQQIVDTTPGTWFERHVANKL